MCLNRPLLGYGEGGDCQQSILAGTNMFSTPVRQTKLKRPKALNIFRYIKVIYLTICHAQAQVIDGLPIGERFFDRPFSTIIVGIIIVLEEVPYEEL